MSFRCCLTPSKADKKQRRKSFHRTPFRWWLQSIWLKQKWALQMRPSFNRHSTAGRPARRQQSLPCYQIKFRSVTSDDLLPLQPDWAAGGSLRPTLDQHHVEPLLLSRKEWITILQRSVCKRYLYPTKFSVLSSLVSELNWTFRLHRLQKEVCLYENESGNWFQRLLWS